MFKKIQKRDGKIVSFNPEKITDAIAAAGAATEEFKYDRAKQLTEKVLKVAEEEITERLYFDEILLSDIIKELERSYDVKITVADDTLNTIRFYGNFRKREQSIQEIMNVLSSTDKMTYTMNGKNIVITLPK